jgi:hypothetical protein
MSRTERKSKSDLFEIVILTPSTFLVSNSEGLQCFDGHLALLWEYRLGRHTHEYSQLLKVFAGKVVWAGGAYKVTYISVLDADGRLLGYLQTEGCADVDVAFEGRVLLVATDDSIRFYGIP